MMKLKRSKYIIFITLLVSLLFSCRKRSIDLEIPYEGKKMVVFAFFNPDSLLSVNVQPTYPPSGKFTYEGGIENAKVSIFENDVLIENLSYIRNGIYKSVFKKPSVGKKYQIKISALGFPDIESTAEMIPAEANLIDISFEDLNSETLIGTKLLSLNVKGDKNSDDFYAVLNTATQGKDIYSLSTLIIASHNPETNPCYFKGIGLTGFTDKCSSNEIIDFKLGLEILNFSYKTKPDKLVLNLRKINYNFYKYYISYQDVDEGLELAFLSPKPRFTNIKGGYGIFATYSQVNFDLKP
jgi:Domain of unknown function (DUF4249)